MDAILIITGGILLGCLIGLSWFAGSDAPYVPTKTARIRKILKLAGVRKGKRFYELGSGDGRVVLEAAKMGAAAFGIEQSLIRVILSKIKSKRLNTEIKPQFIHGDIFKTDFSSADIVFIFLLPKGIEKLERQLKKDLRKGTKIITQTFHFKKWKPYKKILISDKNHPNTLLGENKYEGEFWLYNLKAKAFTN